METSDACVRCDYDLRGVADDQPCPECGLLAERTRQRSDDITDATPRWLRGLATGSGLVLLAHVIAVPWVPTFLTIRPFIGSRVVTMVIGGRSTAVLMPPPFGLGWTFPDYLFLGVFDCAALMLFVGVYLLSRPQRGAMQMAGDRQLRICLRLSALVPAVALAIAHQMLYSRGYLGANQLEPRQLSILLLLTVGSSPFPILLFILLRRLAQRVLHPRLVEHATIVAVGYVATLLLLPVLVLTDYFARSYGVKDWDTRSAAPLAIMITMCVTIGLFGGWTVLNCARFVIAFQKAHRGAQRKWDAADRATSLIAPVPSPGTPGEG